MINLRLGATGPPTPGTVWDPPVQVDQLQRRGRGRTLAFVGGYPYQDHPPNPVGKQQLKNPTIMSSILGRLRPLWAPAIRANNQQSRTISSQEVFDRCVVNNPQRVGTWKSCRVWMVYGHTFNGIVYQTNVFLTTHDSSKNYRAMKQNFFTGRQNMVPRTTHL